MLLKFTTRLQTKYGHLGRDFNVVVTQTVVLTSPCRNLELAGGENELCKVFVWSQQGLLPCSACLQVWKVLEHSSLLCRALTGFSFKRDSLVLVE